MAPSTFLVVVYAALCLMAAAILMLDDMIYIYISVNLALFYHYVIAQLVLVAYERYADQCLAYTSFWTITVAFWIMMIAIAHALILPQYVIRIIAAQLMVSGVVGLIQALLALRIQFAGRNV